MQNCRWLCLPAHLVLQEVLPVFPLNWGRVPLSKRRLGPMATRRELLALAPELTRAEEVSAHAKV